VYKLHLTHNEAKQIYRWESNKRIEQLEKYMKEKESKIKEATRNIKHK
jgi:hypothetical protein